MKQNGDDLIQHITEAAETLGMKVGPIIRPTPEMQAAAAARLEAAEQSIIDASGDLPPLDLPGFEPTSLRNGNKWSDRQDDPLWLLTPAELEQMPEGTVLVCISGERKVVGVDYIDGDTRGGYIAHGLLGSQLSPEARS